MPKATKHSKKAWNKAPDAEVVAAPLNHEAAKPDAGLFFVDVAGQVNSRKQRERIQAAEEEPQLPKRMKRALKQQQQKQQQAAAAEDADMQDADGASAESAGAAKRAKTADATSATRAKKPVRASKVKGVVVDSSFLDPSLLPPSAPVDPLDIWSTAAPALNNKVVASKTAKASWAPQGTYKSKHALTSTEVSVIPAPGASFRPLETDRKALVSKAAAIDAYERANAERDRRRLRGEHVPAVGKEAETAEKEAALSELLAAVPDDDSVATEPRPLKSVKVDTLRHSKAERNRLERKRQREQEEKKRKLEKEGTRQVANLKKIVKEITEEEKELEKRRAEHAELLAADTERKPRLSRHKFKPQFPEVLLEGDVPSSLRELKPSLSAVESQFKRFEARNLIAPRSEKKPIKNRIKYAAKTYNKHKDGETGLYT